MSTYYHRDEDCRASEDTCQICKEKLPDKSENNHTACVRASDKKSICGQCLLCTVCKKVTRLDDTFYEPNVDFQQAGALKKHDYVCKDCRLCIFCKKLTSECGTFTATCTGCESRAHASSSNCTSYSRSARYLCDKCLKCIVCRDVTRLDDRLSSQSKDKPKKIDTYTCKNCRKCIVCKGLTNEDRSQTAFCSGKDSSGKKCTNLAHANKQTNCTILKKKTVQGFKCTDCKKK